MSFFNFVLNAFLKLRRPRPSMPGNPPRRSFPPVVELAPFEITKGKVSGVVDGDTVWIQIGGRDTLVRLSSIDCPESGQPWGDQATHALHEMIGGREVILVTYGQDPYQRTLATIFVEHGSDLINVNERMVVCGHAWVTRLFYGHLPSIKQKKLNQLERWAKWKRIGLWKTDNPVPPWKWRKLG